MRFDDPKTYVDYNGDERMDRIEEIHTDYGEYIEYDETEAM